MIILRVLVRGLLIIIISFFSLKSTNGQNQYQKGWQSLNNAEVSEAIKHFEAALKKPTLREKSLLCLTLLYSQINRDKKASEFFTEYFNNSNDPYPALYSLWFEGGVIGATGKKKPFQFEMLKEIEKDKRNKGKLDAATQYRLSTHYVFSFDKAIADNHVDKIMNIDDWLMLGPFDNVMNSGYDKDFGVVAHPEANAKFISKYGAEITWFDPPISSEDGYLFKDMYFLSSNSIIYAQTYIESSYEREVIIKFGYSGSLKVWLNDSLIYMDPEHRVTEMDYYRYRCKLNKGYNRILVQLGDYEESLPNFTLRLTDSINNPIVLPQKTLPQPYQKEVIQLKRINYFATEELEKMTQKDPDLLFKILLVKAYMRSNELYKAEEILKNIQKDEPRNYFMLRNMIFLYSKTNDNTNQNKYYDLFKENYPQDINILENEIEEYKEEENKEKVRELIATYLSKYPDYFQELSYEMVLANFDQDNEKYLALIDSLFYHFPEDYTALTTKYNIEKSYYSNPAKANKILEKYLENNYNHSVLMELAKNNINEGKIDTAIYLLKKNIDLVPYSNESYRNIVNLLSRQSKYEEAIEVCKTVIENKPSDYNTLSDIAVLHKFLNDKESAISYYEEALRYFPFSFDINEKIRELKGLKQIVDLTPEINPIDLIKDYESNFTPQVKKSYDVVSLSKSLIIFKTKAKGNIQKYILRMNNEKAIKRWQQIDLSPDSYMNIFINDAKTIKKNGDKIDAEQNDSEVVFVNLEVGDYIYVSYTEKQVNGGKSSVFISDRFSLNSYSPVYKVEYNVFVEDGLTIIDTILNATLKPKVSKIEGFTKYQWLSNAPSVIKEESYAIPFNDIAQRIHVSIAYTWLDIVQWYSDLSTHQAVADYTIKKIVKDLFEGKDFTDEEKSKIIYDFVIKNIQYSSIDFRQSGYIPQKASKVYHSRLGDCKDVSTLYVSLARASGLKANLVLINTSDNGQNAILLPSLNFNHTIVKVYLEEGSKYLELTNPDLPYGHLYYYHYGAAILEIPTNNISENHKLTHLKFNPNYKNETVRNSLVEVLEDYKMKVEMDVIKTGTRASSACKSYYYSDDEERKDKLKKMASSKFKSLLTIENLSFEILKPRNDTAKYSYTYIVDNDVLKLGSFRSFKIPFTDLLIEMSIFEDGKRNYEFDFVYYENTDKYDETIMITLNDKFSMTEIPENVHLEYNGSTYDLSFEKLSERRLKVHRVYNVNRINIDQEDFLAFKEFMANLNEAENTHLLFK